EVSAAQGNKLAAIYLTGIDREATDHRRAVQTLAERISRIPNIVDVSANLDPRNLYVRIDREALADKNIDITLVRRRITQFFREMPVGSVRVADEDVAIGIAGSFDGLDDLRSLPLQVNRRGKGVFLREVADVEYDTPEPLEMSRLDGRSDFVSLEVSPSRGADTVDLSRTLHRELDAHAGSILPENVDYEVTHDSSEVIAHEQETLVINGLAGIALVLVVLMLFLGWRVSAMTAIGLPVAYLGTILVLGMLDLSFNLISLVAMILVVGILVDDAIIVAEEFCQHLQDGTESREAVIEAVRKVGKPVLGMAVTT
ncbi:MAG: efflux RND transporter permease subunit, partial [Bradymonadaceae bacterium]